MKLRKLFLTLFTFLILFSLVACGGGTTVSSVEVTGSAASVGVGKTVQLTAVVKPDGVDQAVTWTSAKSTVATVDENGVVTGVKAGKTVITATSVADPNISGKFTITVAKAGAQQLDLGGYEIVITFTLGREWEIDPRLEVPAGNSVNATARGYEAQEWNRIEEEYNCKITVKGYPVDDYDSRWEYILTNAKNNTTEFDVYWVPTKYINQLYTAFMDLSDIYAQTTLKVMNDGDYFARFYKNMLVGWIPTNDSITPNDQIIGVNQNLLERIGVEEPAKLFLDGKWNFSKFKEWCLDAQAKLDSISMGEDDKYYVISGALVNWVRDLSRASGVPFIDATTVSLNLTDPIVIEVADMMKDLCAAGCVDPANQDWNGVESWNSGHALLCQGYKYFVNYFENWKIDKWGEGDLTRYGFAPFPYHDSRTLEQYRWATYEQTTYAIPKAIDTKIQKFGNGYDDVTPANIYRIWTECMTTYIPLMEADPDYDKEHQQQISAWSMWSSQASVDAWLYIENNIKEMALFDPINELGECRNTDWGRAIAQYISPNLGYNVGDTASYLSAITPYLADLNQAFVEKYR